MNSGIASPFAPRLEFYRTSRSWRDERNESVLDHCYLALDVMATQYISWLWINLRVSVVHHLPHRPQQRHQVHPSLLHGLLLRLRQHRLCQHVQPVAAVVVGLLAHGFEDVEE